MKWDLFFYRLGSLGVLLAWGVFTEGPLRESIRGNPSNLWSLAVLFGFAGLAGALLLSVRWEWLLRGSRILYFLAHGAALAAVLWLLLWCFDWLAMMATLGDKAEMYIKHTSFLHLFGVGFSMAGYATGWTVPGRGERTIRFLMTVGWAVSYMACFNLFLQPSLEWLWAPAAGGLAVAASAFYLQQRLKRALEAGDGLAA
jgi:hypothetical protein